MVEDEEELLDDPPFPCLVLVFFRGLAEGGTNTAPACKLSSAASDSSGRLVLVQDFSVAMAQTRLQYLSTCRQAWHRYRRQMGDIHCLASSGANCFKHFWHSKYFPLSKPVLPPTARLRLPPGRLTSLDSFAVPAGGTVRGFLTLLGESLIVPVPETSSLSVGGGGEW